MMVTHDAYFADHVDVDRRRVIDAGRVLVVDMPQANVPLSGCSASAPAGTGAGPDGQQLW
ncbi:hypothetical protein Val02_78530 [Virgisporangium aliadipatigenens]|uniref:Uncharacterized protein n=1 Tax=Virgisporangium aliadipatigenens TaxID=741659 RepID=A0A8J4DWB7_9ACTN|nr:hypothetical protein Val02_78530 [Virgisporangium aliadipatigenens]